MRGYVNATSLTNALLNKRATFKGKLMTKIAYGSDLHLDLDFPEHHRLLSDAPYLILAGDTMESRKIDKATDFFQFLSDNYEKVVFIAGNHEYYGSRIDKTDNKLKEFASKFPNVVFLQNEITMLGNVKVFGATFWTDMGTEMDKLFIRQGMNDFRKITHRNGEVFRKFNPDDAALLHKISINAMVDAKPDVVVMHHAPTELSTHPSYKNRRLNSAYVSRAFQSHLEGGNKYKGIIHGHVHHPFDYNYCGTPIMANPRGYSKYEPGLCNSWSVKVCSFT